MEDQDLIPAAEPHVETPPQGVFSFWSLLRELLETFLIMVVVVFVVRTFVQNFEIDGYSMEPNFHNGERVIVNRLAYLHLDLTAPLRRIPGLEDLPPLPFRLGEPRRGDVIVFLYPRNPKKDFVKRVIGLPGDKVEIRQGVVYVNGLRLEEPYPVIPDTSSMPPKTVPEGHLFVLGDNRPNSSDSRFWGMLPMDHVIGKAWVVYWPPQRWGLVRFPRPPLVPAPTPASP